MACPITTAHGRLNEAHRLWHEAAEAYPEPEEFRTFLNASIQALRNVTFALQKQRGALPDFDAWYGRWQERLRADDVCRWLVEARNRIVKQEDLDLHSTANVSVHSYGDLILWQTTVPPAMSPRALAVGLRQFTPAEVIAKLPAGALLSVERRWVVSDLPTSEILELLAHGHRLLATIIADAHQMVGSDPRSCGREDRLRCGEGGALPCLLLSREARTSPD